MSFRIELEPAEEAYGHLLASLQHGLAAAFTEEREAGRIDLGGLARAMSLGEAATLAILRGERVPTLRQVSDACVALGREPVAGPAPLGA